MVVRTMISATEVRMPLLDLQRDADEVAKASTRNLSAHTKDAVEVIHGQNIYIAISSTVSVHPQSSPTIPFPLHSA